MSTFKFTAAVAVRAYGLITVEADTLEQAIAEIGKPSFSMAGGFKLHGHGRDDFDYDYDRPRVYLESVEQDDECETDLDQDVLDHHDDAFAAMRDLIETVSLGNTDPDRLQALAQELLTKIQGKG